MRTSPTERVVAESNRQPESEMKISIVNKPRLSN